MASRPYIDIPLGPYLPDFGGIPNPSMPGYLVDAINVRLTSAGYRGMPSFTDVASATEAGGSTVGGFGWSFTNGTNTCFFYVNDDGEIWESRAAGSDTWQNNTPSGTAMALLAEFVQFGGDVIAVGSTRAPVSKDLSAAHATDFADLAGSPPTARHVAVIGQHVVLGDLSTDRYAVRTCAIGNHEDWPTPGTADARSKQAISESLNQELGIVSAVLGGEKIGIVMQERGLTRMTYVGGSSVYTFDTFERQYGYGPNDTSKPITDGRFWYWFNDHGFFATDGYSVRCLSDGRIDEAIFTNTLSHPDAGSTPWYSSAHDRSRGLLIFSSRNGNSANIHQLTYTPDTDSFSFLEQGGIFTTFHSVFGTVYSVDPTDRLMRSLTGATGTIAMQTGYIELDPGYRVQLQGAHILGTGTGSLTLAYKTAANSAACDVAQTGFTSLTAAGLGEKKTGRASSQYIAFRITGTGAESQLIRGIRVYFERAEPAP